jgi:hypothetical protein
MRERCLQSLAILLAGLFSAERSRERAQAACSSTSNGTAPERDAAAVPPSARAARPN